MDRVDRMSERQGSLQNVTVGRTEVGHESRDTIGLEQV
jgi:hypothetical protein